MKQIRSQFSFGKLWLSVVVIVSMLMVACGAAAPEPSAATDSAAPAQEVAKPKALAIPATAEPAAAKAAAKPAAKAAPKAAPKPTEAPAAVVSARDEVVVVTNEEPTTLGAASPFCGGNIQNTVCDDIATDPLTWIDDQNDYEVVGLTGIEGWSQLDADTWEFKLRDGVTFHNGAPWNADQAKFWIDFFGDEATSGHYNSNDYSFHGSFSGEVVDDLTLNINCKNPCPILPRTTIFTKFQDVGWYEEVNPNWASQGDDTNATVESMTVGLGPYRIVEWRRGQEVELEAYENYKPNPDTVYAQAPVIKTVIQQWRNEPLVRAAMIESGEADWAEISLDDIERVPQWKSATNNEVYVYAIDTVHHPELRKMEVRQAMALAIDCELLMETVFGGLTQCYGNISQTGTVGITPENSKGYDYDPAKAKELLAAAGYDSANKIELNIRANRIPKDVEYGESVVAYWDEVGINAQLNVIESGVRAKISRSNCGHQRTKDEFAAAAGTDLHEKCAALGPGAPQFVSMQLTESATSTESLDFSRQGGLRNSCYSRSSGVCFSDHEANIAEANATPTGDLRRQRMETIANRVHDEVLVYGNFQVVQIYGLSEHLNWTPTYAPRIRANTMSFSQ